MFTLCMSREPSVQQETHQKTDANRKKQIKGGYLLRYKRGFFCKGWCEEWVVLYEDSTLAWFADKSLSRPRGFVRISEAPELLAVGEWTRKVPRKPRFPRACHIGQLLAVGCRTMHEVHWLMGPSPAEMSDWMTAISNTLPPPPNSTFDEKKLTVTYNALTNGHAKPISNGCAIKIPNGVPPLPQRPVTKGAICSTRGCAYNPSSLDGFKKDAGRKEGGKYDDDHTVLAGVCVNWGHGWGWAAQAPSVVPQISFAAETALSTSVYCHSAEDYMTGYDDIDWSAFGDFCF